jgi:hypothetical protein
VRRPFVSVLIAMMLVSACSGSSGPAPRSSLAGSQSSFSLTPNEVNLTPGMPSDTVYAQGATVGVICSSSVYAFDREYRRRRRGCCSR